MNELRESLKTKLQSNYTEDLTNDNLQKSKRNKSITLATSKVQNRTSRKHTAIFEKTKPKIQKVVNILIQEKVKHRVLRVTVSLYKCEIHAII